MAHPKLYAVLEANINGYWKELTLSDFDFLLLELEKGNRLTSEERESLLLMLGLKKMHGETEDAADAAALQS
jgi:hypothetical protein